MEAAAASAVREPGRRQEEAKGAVGRGVCVCVCVCVCVRIYVYILCK
jgi:hypothetical protein